MVFAAGAGKPPAGKFENKQCIRCHDQRNNALVKAWRDSVHNKNKKGPTCITCHGRSHKSAAATARHNRTCINCHGGSKGAVVHSYATSKHGVIVQLEQHLWDWSQPLSNGNYRAPVCAYCHMHGGNHDVSKGVAPWEPSKTPDSEALQKIRAPMLQACRDCHAPRYVSELFANGDRMLEIGRMKLREAEAVVRKARSIGSGEALDEINQLFIRMQSKHMKNLRNGIGHQSPDYQWWHGQPALDGDLLRIKGAYGRLNRGKINH